jgi:hypothetical protein
MRKLLVVGAVLAALASIAPAAAAGGCRAWGHDDVAALAQTGGVGTLVSGIATSVPRPVGEVVLAEHAAACGS